MDLQVGLLLPIGTSFEMQVVLAVRRFWLRTGRAKSCVCAITEQGFAKKVAKSGGWIGQQRCFCSIFLI